MNTKIYRFKTYAEGRQIYGSVSKYRKAMRFLEEHQNAVKKIRDTLTSRSVLSIGPEGRDK